MQKPNYLNIEIPLTPFLYNVLLKCNLEKILDKKAGINYGQHRTRSIFYYTIHRAEVRFWYLADSQKVRHYLNIVLIKESI